MKIERQLLKHRLMLLAVIMLVVLAVATIAELVGEEQGRTIAINVVTIVGLSLTILALFLDRRRH